MISNHLPRTEQKSFFFTLLRCLSNSYLNKGDIHAIAGVAAIISGLLQENQYLETCLVEWLTTTNGDVVMLGLEMRRAAFAVLAKNEGKLNFSCNNAEDSPKLPRRAQHSMIDHLSDHNADSVKISCRPFWTKAYGFSVISYIFSMIPSCSRKVSSVIICTSQGPVLIVSPCSHNTNYPYRCWISQSNEVQTDPSTIPLVSVPSICIKPAWCVIATRLLPWYDSWNSHFKTSRRARQGDEV